MLTSEFITRTAQEKLAPLGIHVSAPWIEKGEDFPLEQLAEQYKILSRIEFKRRGEQAFRIAYDFLEALAAGAPEDRTVQVLKIMAAWADHTRPFRKADLAALESFWRDSTHDDSLPDIGVDRFLRDVYREHGDHRAIARLDGTPREHWPINFSEVRYG